MPETSTVYTGAFSTALQLAVAMLGGRGMAPTPEAASAFGLPTSQEAICRWRFAGKLPFRETQIGERYFVRAVDLAEALLPNDVVKAAPDKTAETAPPPARPRRGRPRMDLPEKGLQT